MHLAYVHTGTFPSDSPSMTFSAMTAIALSRQPDVRVDFFGKRGSSENSKEILKGVLNEDKPENLNINLISPGIIKSNRFYYARVVHSLKQSLIQEPYNAVITRNVTFLPHLIRLKKRFGFSVFYETHDFWSDLSLRDDINRRKKNRFSKLEKRYIPSLDGVICLQESQRELYRRYFPEQNLYLARTGLKINDNLPEKPGEFLTYIGSLERHKGVGLFLKAANISKTRPSCLIIGGKNQDEIKALRTLALEIGYGEKVIITGWVTKPQLREYLHKTRVGVIPLTNTFFNRYLTSPLKLFDFYAHGIPVIASDLPTLRELVDEHQTGYFFPPGDEKALANAIDLFFQGGVNYSSMRNAVLKKARNLTWEQRASTLLEIIKKHA